MRSDAGFSLVELLTALVVTVVVTAAVFGLMTGGQNAFRREPESTDRQQNIRNALSMIEEDLRAGGYGMPSYTQVFVTGLNNRPSSPTVPSSILAPGEGTDALEFFAGDMNCPAMPACAAALAGDPGLVDLAVAAPACFPPVGTPGLLMVTPVANVQKPGPGAIASYVVGNATALGAVAPVAGCAGNARFSVPMFQGPASWNTGVVGAQFMALPMRVVRYQIAVDPSDPELLPALWRSVTGGRTAADGFGALTAPGADPNWQLLARGVEDLQVRYMSGVIVGAGAGLWADLPSPVAFNDATSVTRRIQVTLSARAATLGQGGLRRGTGAALAPTAAQDIKRGTVSTIVTPRQTIFALEESDAIR